MYQNGWKPRNGDVRDTLFREWVLPDLALVSVVIGMGSVFTLRES